MIVGIGYNVKYLTNQQNISKNGQDLGPFLQRNYYYCNLLFSAIIQVVLVSLLNRPKCIFLLTDLRVSTPEITLPLYMIYKVVKPNNLTAFFNVRSYT